VVLREPRVRADVNAVVGGYLRDLALAQSSTPKMFGYKRAAAAILSLELPLTELRRANGSLPQIPGIGPGSTRVISEILETGTSATVEQAVAGSERRDDIQRRRKLRRALPEPGGGAAAVRRCRLRRSVHRTIPWRSGSDARTTAQLSYAETAMAHARLAAIPVDRIVNCWPLDRLLAWLSDPSLECRR
jgi:hypothetical protein